MNLILIGLQGSGKGVQAGKIASTYGLYHLSMGDELKRTAASGSPEGEQVKRITERGDLVPDELTIRILQSILLSHQGQGIILDGFPRTMNQAKQLQGMLPIDRVIVLRISDEEAVKRISARRICSGCKANYNTIYIKPKQDGVCDECGGTLIQRSDDHPDAVRKRLELSHQNIEPIIDFYKVQGIVAEINGEQTIESVFADIQKVLP